MPRTTLPPIVLLLSLLVGACSGVYPRVGTGGPGSMGPEGSRLPMPGAPVADGDSRPVIEQICRAQARPAGYVVVAYTVEGDRCPRNSDAENPYNGAVVERFRNRPVGSIMVVCADQGIPSGWVRATGRQDRAGVCHGARVRESAPTAITIRRTR